MCGTRLSNGYCPNCDEEAYIADVQIGGYGDELDLPPFSNEFLVKVEEGQKRRKERLKEAGHIMKFSNGD
jgi:5-formaminoimidazole-4-carboxamide-1-beta-D-ribofuranosyl 5'-monophosphate synthetase